MLIKKECIRKKFYIINFHKEKYQVILLNSVIRKINDELQELCKKYNFSYISNDETGRRFLCDAVHLSDNDMDNLACNFVNNINSTQEI